MINPYIFELGEFKIKWYSVLILISIIISAVFIVRESKKFNITKDFIINLLFWTVVIGIIGARIYFVAFSWDYFSENIIDIFKIWEGGLAIHGAIILGFITIVLYCKKYKIKFALMLDIIVPFLLLSQAIGRWGNFFNQEAYGPMTTYTHLQSLHIPEFIINGMFINGNYYIPTFLFESLWCLIGCIVLLIVRHYKYTKTGQTFGSYLMWYSAFRFFIESYRQDSLMFMGFRIAQVVSVVLFTVGLVIVLIQSRKPKLEELYNDNEKIEVLRF